MLYPGTLLEFNLQGKSVVAHWLGTSLASCPLVLEVPGSIPAHSEKNFRV